MKQSRLENLADGILAIVMTLLVLELKVPELSAVATGDALSTVLRAASAPFLAYLLSFAMLFTYWRAHSYIMSSLAKNLDNWLANINAIFLFLVGLVPFTTYLLGRYHNNQAAIIIYGLHVIAIGLSLFWMRHYVKTAVNIENTPVTPAENRRANIRVLMPIFFSLIAIIISIWNTNISFLLFAAAIAFNMFPASARLVNWLLNTFWQEHEEVVYDD